MKIVFAAWYDGREITRGSGTFFHLTRELEKQGHEVGYLWPRRIAIPPGSGLPLPTRAVHRAHKAFGSSYPVYLDPLVIRRAGRELRERLATLEHDVVLTNDPGIAAALAGVAVTVYYSDLMVGAHGPFLETPGSWLRGASPVAIWAIRRSIRHALDRVALAVLPARWSLAAARSYGGNAPLTLIPFGANVADPGPEPACARSLDRVRGKGLIEALFVGKNWLGKGGPVAVEACAALRERGWKVHLHVVGCEPSGIGDVETTVHGFLDMRQAEDRAELDRLYHECDLLLFPSTYEGFGIAPLEAAAYGMPTAGATSIGLDTSIRDGVSGALLPAGAGGEEYAKAIGAWFSKPGTYDELVAGARALFAGELNWSRSTRLLIEAIESQDALRREA